MSSKGFVTVTFDFEATDTPKGPRIAAFCHFLDFDVGSAAPKVFHEVFLGEHAKTLSTVSGSHVNIIGTTSKSGSAAFNKALSKQRADNIMRSFIGFGGDKEHINVEKGIGVSPLAKQQEDFHDRLVSISLSCPPESEDELRAFEVSWNANPLKTLAAPPDDN